MASTNCWSPSCSFFKLSSCSGLRTLYTRLAFTVDETTLCTSLGSMLRNTSCGIIPPLLLPFLVRLVPIVGNITEANEPVGLVIESVSLLLSVRRRLLVGNENDEGGPGGVGGSSLLFKLLLVLLTLVLVLLFLLLEPSSPDETESTASPYSGRDSSDRT